MLIYHIPYSRIPGKSQTVYEERWVQTSFPHPKWDWDRSRHFKENIPCRPHAGSWHKPKPLFLWLQGGSIQCKKAVQLSKRQGALCPKSALCRMIRENGVWLWWILCQYPLSGINLCEIFKVLVNWGAINLFIRPQHLNYKSVKLRSKLMFPAQGFRNKIEKN